jgi:hypothetical protein
MCFGRKQVLSGIGGNVGHFGLVLTRCSQPIEYQLIPSTLDAEQVKKCLELARLSYKELPYHSAPLHCGPILMMIATGEMALAHASIAPRAGRNSSLNNGDYLEDIGGGDDDDGKQANASNALTGGADCVQVVDNAPEYYLQLAMYCAQAALAARAYVVEEIALGHSEYAEEHSETLRNVRGTTYVNLTATSELLSAIVSKVDEIRKQNAADTRLGTYCERATTAIKHFNSKLSVLNFLVADWFPESGYFCGDACSGNIPSGQWCLRITTYLALMCFFMSLLLQLVLSLALVGLPDDHECYMPLGSNNVSNSTTNSNTTPTTDSKLAVTNNAFANIGNASAALISLVVHVIGAIVNKWRTVSFAGIVIAGGSLASAIATVSDSHCDLEVAAAYVAFIVAFLGLFVSNVFIFVDGKIKPQSASKKI